jgi:hypothetical protein
MPTKRRNIGLDEPVALELDKTLKVAQAKLDKRMMRPALIEKMIPVFNDYLEKIK